MSEYLIQGETLTGIADKIRPLLGLTGTMTPEQMQTNLTTEQANIAAALAALTEKGVEVPEGANSNALAGLIEAIEAGGGVGPFNEIIAGTVTPAQDITSLVINASNPIEDAKNYLFAIGFLDMNSQTFASNHTRIGVSTKNTRIARGLSSTSNMYVPDFLSDNQRMIFSDFPLQMGVTYFYIMAVVWE